MLLHRVLRGGRLIILGAAAASLLGCQQGARLTATAASHDLARSWMPYVSGQQAEALSDSEVSLSEYQDALNNVRHCIEGDGFSTTPLHRLPDLIRWKFSISSDTPDRGPEEIAAAWDTCWRGGADAVESVYLAQHVRPATEASEVEQELLECLKRDGVSIHTGLSDFDLAMELERQHAADEGWYCRERYLILTGRVGERPPEAVR